jgi:hypothetical protein
VFFYNRIERAVEVALHPRLLILPGFAWLSLLCWLCVVSRESKGFRNSRALKTV